MESIPGLLKRLQIRAPDSNFTLSEQAAEGLAHQGHQTLLYFRPGYVKGKSYKNFLTGFWDNKLEFWPEGLHILNKRGQNPFLISFVPFEVKSD